MTTTLDIDGDLDFDMTTTLDIDGDLFPDRAAPAIEQTGTTT